MQQRRQHLAPLPSDTVCSSDSFRVPSMAKSNAHLLIPRTADGTSPAIAGFGTTKNFAEPPPPVPPATTSVQESKNLKKSGGPTRFLLFRGGSWIDFPPEVLDVLRDGLDAGRMALEVPVGGTSYLFDFLRMTRVDLKDGVSSSIGWIDADGRCFFPRVLLDGQRNSPSLDKGREGSSELHQEHSDETPETSTTTSLDQPREWPGAETLSDGDRHYKVVEKLFLDGMRRFDPNVTITSVRKCLHSSCRGNSRLEAFQTQIQTTKAARGHENVRFGWYGTTASDLAVVIGHGFGRTNNSLLGSHAHGVGVHLSPPHSPHSSSTLSEVDSNGDRHILLCRAIMGKSEKVEAGSLQYHPSSDEFDSGVDDLTTPKWYIVWSTHMNTHILPEYIVSFRSSCHQSQGHGRRMSSRRRPSISSTSFSKLFAEIAKLLPSSMSAVLGIKYNQFREGKISKESFIRYLRSTVGDKLLISTIRKMYS
ncbi:unnamed protein product [Musa acuminata subsp. burmannicoides]